MPRSEATKLPIGEGRFSDKRKWPPKKGRHRVGMPDLDEVTAYVRRQIALGNWREEGAAFTEGASRSLMDTYEALGDYSVP